MADRISAERRSWNMSRIKAANTKPEIAVRSLLHQMGYRFRIHVRSLPGKPDIVLPKYKATIFVHGCFWHQHPGCKYAYTPKSRDAFWKEKLRRNIERHGHVNRLLEEMGWSVLIVWECEVRDVDALTNRFSIHLPEVI